LEGLLPTRGTSRDLVFGTCVKLSRGKLKFKG
jgi:hypothetical protein